VARAVDRRPSPGPLKVEKAYQELRRMIITHELPPGTAIEERDLIEMLDTGRTPLREAMLRLAHERLIVRSPRRGAWVSHLSLADMRQLTEARTLVEPLIARRAAEQITEVQLHQIRSILQSVELAVRDDDFASLAIADLEYHILLGKVCRNEYLTSFSLEINTSLLRYWRISFQINDSGMAWYQTHSDLVDLLEQGDPDRAEREVLHHIDMYRQRMRKLVV
jgi:DNA-binding GntR family transcriptional regulator